MIEDTIETGRQYASTTLYEGIGRVTREMQEMIYADEDPMGTGDNVPKYEEFLRVYSYIMIDQWNESMGGESEQSEEKARGPWSLYLANLSQKVPKKLKFLEDDLPAWRQQVGTRITVRKMMRRGLRVTMRLRVMKGKDMLQISDLTRTIEAFTEQRGSKGNSVLNCYLLVIQDYLEECLNYCD
jgi:hypothetical protein